MPEKKQINADIPGSINDFESVMKTFRMKEQIFKILLPLPAVKETLSTSTQTTMKSIADTSEIFSDVF